MSARSFSLACLSAVMAIRVGASTAAAQSPQLPLKVIISRNSEPEMSEDCGPAETPVDLRLFFRCLLHGLHPATGFLPLDDLIDFDDAYVNVGLLPDSAVYGVGLVVNGGPLSAIAWAPIGQQNPAQLIRNATGYTNTSFPSDFDPRRFPGGMTGFAPTGTYPSELDRPINPHVADHSPPQATCPYSRHQSVGKNGLIEPERLGDFQVNLEKLTLANKLFEMGKYHLQMSDRDGAFYFFAQIHGLCPGSRYDAEAAKQIQEMARFGDASIDAAGAYEQEMQLTPSGCLPLFSPSLQHQLIEQRRGAADVTPLPPLPGSPLSTVHEVGAPNIPEPWPHNDEEANRKREQAAPRCVFSWGDQEFPNVPASTDQTGSTENQLQRPVTVDIKDAPLKDVLEAFRTMGQISIVIDYSALSEEEMDLDRPVSLQLDQVKFKSVLSLLVKKVHLTYQIEGGVVKITTEKRAAGPLVVRFYLVPDLVEEVGRDKNARLDPRLWLVGFIRNTEAPRSWVGDGGQGALGFIPLTSCLVVCQSMDVHEQIEDLFALLRRNADSEKTPTTQTETPRPSDDPKEAPKPEPIPELPSIDPKIVETLQKVLKQAGDLGVPRLILHVEEQPASEEKENPEISEWRSQPTEAVFPSLFVDPVDDPLTIVEEGEPAEKVEPSPVDLNSLIQEVIDVIHAGQSVLVENAGVGLEVELEVDLNGANIKVLTGYSGHRFVLVSLSPEAAGDLRAAQWAHNDRILRWIESLNEELFDCDAAEEEDAGYGVEPVNEAIP